MQNCCSNGFLQPRLVEIRDGFRTSESSMSTLNRGEGLLKIVTFPSRKRVFRLFTDTVEMSSEMRLYRNWRRLCRSSMDWWINLLRYEISRIFDFFLIFLDSFTWFLWLFSKKCRKIPKMSSFPSRNAYLRRDEPGIFCGRHCFADMLSVPEDFGTP